MNVNIVKTVIEKLNTFSYYGTEADFQFIFGKHMGSHLWGKFKKADRDIVAFFYELDRENSEKFLKAVAKLSVKPLTDGEMVEVDPGRVALRSLDIVA
ncbi:MAG: hypothetical protein HPY53_01550 [Brevinematales bacterium]|nr:hypothetical protein [Brevinematales bacterium]